MTDLKPQDSHVSASVSPANDHLAAQAYVPPAALSFARVMVATIAGGIAATIGWIVGSKLGTRGDKIGGPTTGKKVIGTLFGLASGIMVFDANVRDPQKVSSVAQEEEKRKQLRAEIRDVISKTPAPEAQIKASMVSHKGLVQPETLHTIQPS